MSPRRRRSHRMPRQGPFALLEGVVDRFFEPPEGTCPKCTGGQLEYYDPYIFNLWRTLTNRRRLRCRTCGFVWRKSRGQPAIGPFGQPR